MRYFKLINGSEIIGVISDYNFRKYQTKHSLILFSDIETAQYVEFHDVFYRDNWLRPLTTDIISYTDVSIVRIEESEYNAILEAFETQNSLPVETEEEPVIEEPFIDENEQITIEFVRNAKIKQLSNICNQTIENGFDIILSDNKEHHFSLTTQDQLNLVTLTTQLAAGASSIPYHADCELCKFYTAEDIRKIVEAATAHKTYHVTYFNTLRSYVDQLESISEIHEITYGTEIPDEYQSDVMKHLLAEMNNVE